MAILTSAAYQKPLAKTRSEQHGTPMAFLFHYDMGNAYMDRIFVRQIKGRCRALWRPLASWSDPAYRIDHGRDGRLLQPGLARILTRDFLFAHVIHLAVVRYADLHLSQAEKSLFCLRIERRTNLIMKAGNYHFGLLSLHYGRLFRRLFGQM